MKLFRVTCKGMTYSLPGGVIHGVAYVVANNPDEAYLKLKTYLDERDIGFSRDRVLNMVELIAETGDYPDCGMSLHL